MSATPANLQWLGIAKETVSGTPQAAPAFWVPLVDPEWNPDITPLKDDSLRGNMGSLQGQVAGPRVDSFNYKTYLYLDTLFPHMMNILGGADVVVGASDPVTHKVAMTSLASAQPPTWTLFPFNGAETWRIPGATLASVDIDLKADALGTMDVSWMGLPAVQFATPTNTPSTLKPFAAWNTVVTIAATQSLAYTDVKLSYKRALEAIHTNDGSQAPFTIFVGDLDVTGEFTGVYQGVAATPTDLTSYLTNVQQAFTVAVNPVGDAVHSATWRHSLAAYDSVQVKGSGGKYMEVSGKFAAIVNATDTNNSAGPSPALFTLINAVVPAY